MPSTKPDMEVRLGITRSSIYRVFQTMDKSVDYHVGDWVQGAQGCPCAVFHKGPGKDAPCPGVIPKDRRTAPRIENAPIFRHWMDVALFGHGPARGSVCYLEEEE